LVQIAKAVNVTTIALDDAVARYRDFDRRPRKFVIDPHGLIAAQRFDALRRPTAAPRRAFARRAP
jgi:hypothetical protein